MLRRTTAVVAAALVLGAVAAPAALAKGRPDKAGKKAAASARTHGPSHKGGKKPIGQVASFDGTTLTVTMQDGSSDTATADEDTQVKLDHRGRPAAKGNPTRGGLDDLVAGALVLRMKTDEGELEKIRIRRAVTGATTSTCTDDDDADEAELEESDEAELETQDDETDESNLEDADECDEVDEDEDEDDEDDAEDLEEEEDEEDVDGFDQVVEDLPLP